MTSRKPKASLVLAILVCLLMSSGAFLPLTTTASDGYKEFKISKHLLNDHGGEYVSWSPDGKYVVSQFASNQQKDYSFRYWKTSDWSWVEVPTEQAGIIYAFDWSPDSSHLVTVFRDIIVYDVKGDWTPTAPLPVYGNEMMVTVDWHPTENKIAVGTEPGEVFIVNTDTMTIVKNFTASETFRMVQRVAWSPDGKMLAASIVNGQIKVYDTVTWKLKWTFTDHTNAVKGLAWSPDSKQLVSASFDGNIFLYDLVKGAFNKKIGGHGQGIAIYDVQWSAKGNMIVTSGAQYICTWDTTSFDLLQRIEKGHGNKEAMATTLAWDPNGGRFMATGLESVDVWSQNVPATNDPLTQIYSNICGIILAILILGIGGYAGYQYYLRQKLKKDEEEGIEKEEEEEEEEEADEDEEEEEEEEEEEDEPEEEEEEDAEERRQRRRDKRKGQKKKGW
jgi:WD40 repeat protein